MARQIIFIILLLLSLFSAAKNPRPDSVSSNNTEIKGNLFVNLTFIKAGEDHNTFLLEKAIDQVKIFLLSEFRNYKINFHHESTIELDESPEKLLKSWNDYNLPHLKNELAIYIYPGSKDQNNSHTYSFLLKGSDIAIVPFFNQSEFNHYVLKNILHMLGVDVVKFNTWKNKQENKFEIFIAQELSIDNRLFVNETVKLIQKKNKTKKYNKKTFLSFFNSQDEEKSDLNFDIACLARLNLRTNPMLTSKKTKFSIPTQSSLSFNSQSFTTITQWD